MKIFCGMVVLGGEELRGVFPHVAIALLDPIKLFMPYPSSHASQHSVSPVIAASPQPVLDAPLIGFLVIAFALSLVLTSFGYKKYRAYQRTRLLQRQIAILETMWRISSAKRER
jgi:hypothetical protein